MKINVFPVAPQLLSVRATTRHLTFLIPSSMLFPFYQIASNMIIVNQFSVGPWRVYAVSRQPDVWEDLPLSLKAQQVVLMGLHSLGQVESTLLLQL